MSKLTSLLIFILQNYYKDNISLARLIKLVYLADWIMAINKQITISTIKWFFKTDGPFSDDILAEIEKNKNIFEILEFKSQAGMNYKTILLKDKKIQENLLVDFEKKCVLAVLSKTKDLYWDNFIETIYKTYPIQTSNKEEILDLIIKAKEYLILKEKIVQKNDPN